MNVPPRLEHVDPRLLREAKRLSGGDWRRVVAESPTRVITYDQPQTFRTELPPVMPRSKRARMR